MAVSIKLDRERRLRYRWKEVKLLKQRHEINLLNLENTDFTDPDVISAVLWAGLLADDPEITIDRVDELIDLSQLKYIGKQISAAILQAVETLEGNLPGPVVSPTNSPPSSVKPSVLPTS